MVLQSLHKYNNLPLYNRVAKFKRKRSHNTSSVHPLDNRSDRFNQPVRPVCMTLHGELHRPVRPVRQNRQGAHLAHACATPQPPNLLVSVYHFPPLCISADKFDAAGAEIDVWVP